MNRQILCCGLEPIKNTALGKEFLYCRECKKEVEEIPQGISSEASLKYFDEESPISTIKFGVFYQAAINEMGRRIRLAEAWQKDMHIVTRELLGLNNQGETNE